MITIYKNEVIQDCGMCGQKSKIKLTDAELEAYEHYLAHEGPIQNLLPTLNACEREFLKSGYCKNCQKLLFNNGKSAKISYIS